MSLARRALAALRILLLAWIVILWAPLATENTDSDSAGNLAANPSFEILKERDAAGGVFADWDDSKSAGGCSFAVGLVAHTGRTSALLDCASAGEIRLGQQRELAPGRYSISACACCACAGRLRMGIVRLKPAPLSGAELLKRFCRTVP